MKPASDSCLVLDRTARFTALADGVVRMEYHADGQFEDRPTVRVLPRPKAVPFSSIDRAGAAWVLRTARMSVRYTPDGLAFHEGNLAVSDAAGQRLWVPGQVDHENLGGAHLGMDNMSRRTIPRGVHPAGTSHHKNDAAADLWTYIGYADGVALAHERYEAWHLEQILATNAFEKLQPHIQRVITERAKHPPGLLSRAGYFLYDDSASMALGADGWLAERASGGFDWYLFAYGRDFVQALADLALVFGPTPLPPRYSFGCWYSRYPTFNQKGLETLVEDFEKQGLPLDVLVLDLEWHQRGWYGFDWDRTHIPDPDALLAYLRKRNIHTTFNVHPNGVPVDDSRFPEYVKRAGIDYDESKIGKDRIFYGVNAADRRNAEAFLDVLHLPVQKQGLDYWWIDGQMGVGEAPVDKQLWTNHVYFESAKRTLPDRRPMIFSRAGGFGTQRYPFHFTGDTWCQWEVLQAQVEYTCRAGHLGRSFVTHDIGGHMSPGTFVDPELYCRWVQFGALSPLFRLHSSKGGERRPWVYGDTELKCFQAALRLRMELLPYLYTLARASRDTGLPMCRSSFIQYPEWEQAYSLWDSYCLGDRIFVTPLVGPGDARDVLLPPGDWWCGMDGRRVASDGLARFPKLAITEKPPLHWIRAGSVLIKQPYALRASTIPDQLIVELYPLGRAASDTFDLYEDDGDSRSWETGASARTDFTFRESAGGELSLTIGAARGSFRGQPVARRYEIRLFGRTRAVEAGSTPALPYVSFTTDSLSLNCPHRIPLNTLDPL
jgi:alpha-glucosidase (family GH31 glycosyl hydrolase)